MIKNFFDVDLRKLVGMSTIWMFIPFLLVLLWQVPHCFFLIPISWSDWLLWCIVPLLVISIIPFLVGLLLVSAGHLVLKQKTFSAIDALPLVLNCVTALILLLQVPDTLLGISVWWNWDGYDHVVQLVEEGKVQSVKSSLALLPPEYQYLSACGGEILIDKRDDVTRVLFFTYRNPHDDFAGIVYRSDNLPPQRDDFSNRVAPLHGWSSIRQIRANWFFANHF